MYLEQCIAFPFTYFLSKWRMSFLNRVLIEKIIKHRILYFRVDGNPPRREGYYGTYVKWR